MARQTEPMLLTQSQRERIALLREKSAEPFVALLDRIMGAEPSPEALKKWASARPDAWGMLIKQIGALAGYDERRTVEHTGILGHIHKMSDTALHEALQSALHEISHDGQKVLDLHPDESDNVTQAEDGLA